MPGTAVATTSSAPDATSRFVDSDVFWYLRSDTRRDFWQFRETLVNGNAVANRLDSEGFDKYLDSLSFVSQRGVLIKHDTDLKGKWSLIYFGYTHCPDACPTALNDISIALSELGPKRDAVRPVFITVDPERDTPDALKAYVTSFDAPILALTGTAEQVAKAARGYRVYYAKHPEAGGDYSMDHSSVIYVMDPEGRFTASCTHEGAPEQIA